MTLPGLTSARSHDGDDVAIPPAAGSNGTRSCSLVAPQSVVEDPRLPERRVATSAALGWRTIFAHVSAHPAHAEAFTTPATPDLLIVLILSGSLVIECQDGNGWRRARYRPGSMGVTAPGVTSTLRWHAPESEPHRSLHVLVAGPLLQETAERLGRPSLAARLPDALVLDDPVVRTTAHALGDAVAHRADALHADSLGQALALHIVYGRLLRDPIAGPPPVSGALSLRALERVVDYMETHLDQDIGLEELAGVAMISKYHFLRLFTQATGMTPHRYLVALRMQRAARLIRRTRDPIRTVASRCGYASPSRFAAAFRRHHGATPSQVRREAQR